MNKCTCFYFCDYACLHPHQRLKGCKATHTDLPLSVSFHKTEIHGGVFSPQSLTSVKSQDGSILITGWQIKLGDTL